MPSQSPAAQPAGGNTRALRDFLATEAAGGVLLLVATVVALTWANSPLSASYEPFWHTALPHVGWLGDELDLRQCVNEGLMAVFFLVVALEVKRELLLGELRDRRRAALPVLAALGGMVVPALVFLAVNPSGPSARGWGIPMATDIAFALAVLALVARSAPAGVRLFLLTLAIVDDIGAIVVIAVFYSSSLQLPWLLAAVATLGVLVLLRRLWTALPAGLVAGAAVLWLLLRAAGIHPTLAGVAVGLLVPAHAASRRTSTGETAPQLERLEHRLHPWSSLLIVPVFALANAGIAIHAGSLKHALNSRVTVGVVAGLMVGKCVGIFATCWIAVRLRVADLPAGATWRHMLGVAILGGVGFTVSLFISALAFDGALLEDAKIGILLASLLASAIGAALLRARRSA